MQCNQCPSTHKQSSQSRTFCMPNDTPKDVTFSSVGDIQSLLLLANNTNNFAQEFQVQPNTFAILILAAYKYKDNKLICYGSTSTGNPNSKNYEEKDAGKNILLPLPRSSSLYYIPYYYTVQSSVEQNIVQAVTIHSLYENMIVSKKQEFSLAAKTVATYVFFSTFEEYEVGSRVNITAVTFGEYAECRQSLYYCEEDPFQQYPNDFIGCRQAVQDTPGQSATTTYVTRARSTKGKVYFAVFPYCSFSKTLLMMQVLVTKVQ